MNPITTVDILFGRPWLAFVGESDAAVTAMTIRVRLLMGNHRLLSVRRVPIKVGLEVHTRCLPMSVEEVIHGALCLRLDLPESS